MQRLAPFLAAFMLSTGAVAAAERSIVLAGGCFWCVEADFDKVAGVTETVTGYTGGVTENPSYREVSSGGTGHYEAVRITYDEAVISTRQVLDLFLRSVDPLDAGGQFCDRGESYRTAVFVADEEERTAAEEAVAAAEQALGQAIVTPVLGVAPFWPAEDYHQGYYRSSAIVITRFGPLTRAAAYKRYRDACGRDARVRAVWGEAAPFAAPGS
ncbi:MAG: peptide-methionine (S)-S-oxide reductase [Alphaproteobacteria bacterium HGW-Alphaproteobacteria-2]|nr:MAG: peptide-methionine (S)-S-oxide reductase [Alphaproteobacteria bacterium HGW-Alphaproteobacteria-2]